MRTPEPRPGLVIMAGLPAAAVASTADSWLRTPGTVVVHHDLRRLAEGVVTRRVRHLDNEQVTAVELAHGCVSCALREDLLPLLVTLARKPWVHRIVLHLDPVLDPESICWALRHVLRTGDITVLDVLDIEAVCTVVDTATWLADATGDDTLAERGLAVTAADARTIAELAVGQVEFADALILSGIPRHTGQTARVHAVLDRLAPTAARTRIECFSGVGLLPSLPLGARRGELDDPHGAILRGEPPLDPECGCALTVFSARRPFHPVRLHDAMDLLLDGVVRSRGRVWIASQPDVALWLESAGGGLRVAHAGAWLAALDQSNWDNVSPERRAMAALRWDDYYGDRDQRLTIITHRGDPRVILDALDDALLTDAELATGWDAWANLPDPFGRAHTEPCTDRTPALDSDTPTQGDHQ